MPHDNVSFICKLCNMYSVHGTRLVIIINKPRLHSRTHYYHLTQVMGGFSNLSFPGSRGIHELLFNQERIVVIKTNKITVNCTDLSDHDILILSSRLYLNRIHFFLSSNSDNLFDQDFYY